MVVADQTLDCKGLSCPMPILKLAKKMRLSHLKNWGIIINVSLQVRILIDILYVTIDI